MGLLPSLSLWCIGLGLADGLPVRALHRLIIEQARLQEHTQVVPDITSLTARMAKGDEAAYQFFFSLYFNRLLRYLLVLTANEENAREALQLTFLRVARHIRKFDSEPALWSWLTVLARSAVIDESRKSKRYLDFLGRLLERKRIEPEGQHPGADVRLLELLESNLPTLEEADRALLERKYCDGESVRQIAEELQLSEKAVDSRLVRARQQLRELILAELKHER